MRKIAVCTLACFALSVSYTLRAGQQGPQKDPVETVAKPKPKGEGSKPGTLKVKDPNAANLATFKSDISVVDMDVAVLDAKGNFIPKIRRENFRVTEDGVVQKISDFSMTSDAPMTVCLVIEFSNLFQQFWTSSWYQTLQATYGFVQSLKKEDEIGVVAYDIRPEILSDITSNKQETEEALARLKFAAFSEANLFDALTDTVERMQGIEGRKAIVLISSGVDTFSKLTFDKTRKIVQNGGVPIYTIGLMQALREWYDARGYMGSIARMDFLQADNQMKTFANESGGMAFFPRFEGEFPGIFQSISGALRSLYSLSYQPANQAKDGKQRKIKVDLIDPATNQPLKIVDQNGKVVKYRIVTRTGYTAPKEVQ